MKSYTAQREEFIATVSAEGLPISVIRTILAKANTLQRISELSCSSAVADRDRVPCPATKSGKLSDCICGCYSGWSGPEIPKIDHQTVPRIEVQERRIIRSLESLMEGREGFKLNFQGDPRGATVKLSVPSGKYDDMAREGLCVPSKGLSASYWEREERINQAFYAMQNRRIA